MLRERLPNRRRNETMTVTHDGRTYAITVGYDPATGEVREIFTHGAKVGSAMDAILDDTCIPLSILLLHGVQPSSFVGSMGRLGPTGEPASIVGRLASADREASVRPCRPAPCHRRPPSSRRLSCRRRHPGAWSATSSPMG